MSESTDTPTSSQPASSGGLRPSDAGFALRSPVAWAVLLVVLVVGLAADLWTKHAAWEYFVYDTRMVEGRVQLITTGRADYTVAENWLELTAVANQGAAMGLGQGMKKLFLGVSVVAVGFLVWFFAGSGKKRLYQALLGMLLAGVLGNFYDRLQFGYVRDMIHIFPRVQYSDVVGFLPSKPVFPWVFNLADVYLCVGVAIVIVWTTFFVRDEDEAVVSKSKGSGSKQSTTEAV